MKISIIVPIYNVEKYINKCIESIINQTYTNLEIILVDDGSPDNCGKICDEYAKKDRRIKVIHKKNGGLSDARNKGINLATGDYIMYVDSDDYLELTACEELFDVITKTNSDIVCFNLVKKNEFGEIIDNNNIYSQENTKKIIKMTYKEAMIDNLYRKNIRYEAGSKIYINKIAKKIEFPINMLAEDYATFYKFLNQTNNIVFYDRCLYNYIQRAGSIMSEKKVKLYTDIFITEKNIYKELDNICINKNDKIAREKRHFNNLIKIYAKLYRQQDKEIIKIEEEVENHINEINFKLLGTKEKIIYIVYKINKRFLIFAMKKIYKKI